MVFKHGRTRCRMRQQKTFQPILNHSIPRKKCVMIESQDGKPEVSSQAEPCLSSLWVPMSHRTSDTWGTPARAQHCRHQVNKGWLMSPGWAEALAEFPPNLGSSKDPALPAPPQAPLFTKPEESPYFWHLWLTTKCTWNKPMDSKATRTVSVQDGRMGKAAWHPCARLPSFRNREEKKAPITPTYLPLLLTEPELLISKYL